MAFLFFFFSCRRRHVSHYTLSVCEPRRSEPDTTSLRTLRFRRYYYVHLWCSEALSIASGFGTRQLMLWGFFYFHFRSPLTLIRRLPYFIIIRPKGPLFHAILIFTYTNGRRSLGRGELCEPRPFGATRRLCHSRSALSRSDYRICHLSHIN